MEKNGEHPSAYQNQSFGYGGPQAPPSYNEINHQPGQQQPYPPSQPQPYPGTVPPPQQVYQQYPNVVVQQPVVITPGASGAPPPDHMTAAIFATLCCFWPTGILAIMKANDAKYAWMRGDTALAHDLARRAKTMVNVSIIAGICSIIIVAIIVGIYVGIILKNLNDINSYDDDY